MERRYGDDIMGQPEREDGFSSFSIYGAELTSRTPISQQLLKMQSDWTLHIARQSAF